MSPLERMRKELRILVKENYSSVPLRNSLTIDEFAKIHGKDLLVGKFAPKGFASEEWLKDHGVKLDGNTNLVDKARSFLRNESRGMETVKEVKTAFEIGDLAFVNILP